MRVVDLFCGLKGWSRPFQDRGHEVWTTDIDPLFEPDLVIDMLTLTVNDLPWQPDIILASPPCESFSTMVMGRNWTHEGEPKTEKAKLGRELVHRTVELIEKVQPTYFVIENPRARLRTLGFIPFEDRRTVWYCRLGEPVAKPTDLWGGFPASLELPPVCHNGHPDHIAAPRGSRTGTQGVGRYSAAVGKQGQDPKKMRRGSLAQVKAQLRDLHGTSNQKVISAARAKIPYGLALTIGLAAEHDFETEAVA